MRIDFDKLVKRINMNTEQTRKDIDEYRNTCKCKDTLSTMIDGKPTCAKCGKIQVD